MMTENIKNEVQIIENRIKTYLSEDKTIFLSSSFQTHSIPLLHLISRINSEIPIYFIDTGYHFPETIAFRDKVSDLLSLNTIDLVPSTGMIDQRDHQGRLHFCSDTEKCCSINKVEPLKEVLIEYDIWISGVRKGQSAIRALMKSEEKGPHNTVRYHPLLNWNAKDIWTYRKEYNLPAHPLEEKGYLSIGCAPCTQRSDGSERMGRWNGQQKNECGLHTELITK